MVKMHVGVALDALQVCSSAVVERDWSSYQRQEVPRSIAVRKVAVGSRMRMWSGHDWSTQYKSHGKGAA